MCGWTAEGFDAGMYIDIEMWLSAIGTFRVQWTGYMWMDIDVDLARKTNDRDLAMAINIVG